MAEPAPRPPAAPASPIQLHGEEQPATPSLEQVPDSLDGAANDPNAPCGMAINAFVSGLIGIPVLPIVFGLRALREIRDSGGVVAGRGAAIAGIVLGSLNIVWFAILLAVVVPDLRSNQDGASATQAPSPRTASSPSAAQAQGTIRLLVTAVEACSVTTPDRSALGCDSTRISAQVPSLAPLLARCGQPGGGCIQVMRGTGYLVAVRTTDSPATSYIEQHGLDHSVTRTCTGPACPGGTW